MLALAYLVALVVQSGCRPAPPIPPPSPGGTGGTGWVDYQAGGSAGASPLATGGTAACRARVTREASPRVTPRSRTPRIVGGHPALAGVWPWAVALESSTGWQYCGAALYRGQWLVPGGHWEVRPGGARGNRQSRPPHVGGRGHPDR